MGVLKDKEYTENAPDKSHADGKEKFMYLEPKNERGLFSAEILADTIKESGGCFMSRLSQT